MTTKELHRELVKIRRFINGMVKVEFKSGNFSALNITRKIIYIGKDQKNQIILFSLLHEIGHHLIKIIKPNIYETDCYQDGLQNKDEKIPLTKPQKKLILGTEKRAWEKGEIVAKLLDIKLPNGYNNFKNKCLSEYKKV